MTDLVSVQKGEAKFELKVENAEVKMILGYDGKQANAGVYVNLSVDAYLDMLAAAIPGELDDKFIEMLKVAMK